MNQSVDLKQSGSTEKASRVRYMILAMLFTVTTINYADRASLSIAGSDMQADLGITATQMGYLFSAFSWAYVLGQLPGGWLLDRFGSKRVYGMSILMWSLFTLLQGVAHHFTFISTAISLFLLRFMMGFFEAPAFPANSRISAAWFPTKERGTAAAIFSSAQYFSLVLFAPLMGFITHQLGWHMVFIIMGCLGCVMFVIWLRVIDSPLTHSRINAAELAHLKQGGALVDMDTPANRQDGKDTLRHLKHLLSNRMMLGVYVAQYCINGLTYFFLTWFPVYLVQERGMSILKAGFVASLPGLCGFFGGVLGGLISDALLRRGHSLTVARKTPIILGMLISMSLVLCNYITLSWLVIAVMSLSFFGKGLGAMGWAVIADTAPKESAGICGALFNTFGSCAGIVTPIVIGYLVAANDGGFAPALVYVGLHALVAIICYLFVVGEIRRIDFNDDVSRPARVMRVS